MIHRPLRYLAAIRRDTQGASSIHRLAPSHLLVAIEVYLTWWPDWIFIQLAIAVSESCYLFWRVCWPKFVPVLVLVGISGFGGVSHAGRRGG